MEALGIVTAPDTLRIERILPGPIERVWAYLTQSKKRAQWFAGGEMDAREGESALFEFRHANLSHEKETPERFKGKAEGVSFTVTITKCEKPTLLAFTWPEGGGVESEVEFALTPQGKDVKLVLTHRRIGSRKNLVGFAGGWHTHLGILIDRLNGNEPRGFWSSHAAIEKQYEAHVPKG